MFAIEYKKIHQRGWISYIINEIRYPLRPNEHGIALLNKPTRILEELQENADLILFELSNSIENTKTSAIIEVKTNSTSVVNPIHRSLFLLQNGVVKDMFTGQLFEDSHNINTYPELGEHLIIELETRRKFNVANRDVIVIQCGENGILRNIQSEGNKAIFRFHDNPELNARFTNVIDNAHIILNPIHLWHTLQQIEFQGLADSSLAISRHNGTKFLYTFLTCQFRLLICIMQQKP